MNKILTRHIILTAAMFLFGSAAMAQVNVGGSVFGGGNKANVGGKSTVLIDQAGAVIEKDVYGGGALANVDTINKNLLNTVTLTQGTVEQDIYGGGLGDASHAAKVYGPVQVIMYGGQARNVFGCNNVNGAPQSTVNVTINDGEVSQSVFGGGNLAAFEGSPVVNINDGEITENVFGGGNLADVLGSTTVNINGGTITLDVYGGGALADVGTDNSNNTVVNVLGGTVNGNVYGGGLGRKQEGNDPTTAIPAAVNGVVTVNIGALTGALDGDGFAPSESVSGEATIRGYVFGCNNTNGSPKDNVTVNIYKTYRTTEQQTSGTGFALSQVFGGGNQANYEPATTGKKATVHIWTCDNTIQYVYGGGNAADLGTPSINSATDVIIDGGRIEWVFGGGNGYSETNNHTDPTAPNYNPGANVNGNTQVTYHAGNITYVFGGSNQWGNVSGSKTVDILSDGTCTYDNHITELYGGNNEAPSTGDISLTMGCPEHLCDIGAVYGGSRNANIDGDVTLTIEGGQYDKVFGGNNIGGTINGNVTLNLYGGTINSAFGGNNAGGEIKKSITVNLLDAGNSQCPLQVDTIYGGGQEAAYTPDLVAGKKIVSPVVNLWHGTVGHAGSAGNPNVAGCVFGGGKGSGAIVTAHPKVVIGDTITGHDANNRVTIYYNGSDFGNIFGGGNAAAVDGIDSVLMLKVNSKVGNLFGGGNMADADSTVVMMTVAATVDTIFGGGNKAGLDGAALVEVAAGTVRGGLYGGSNASGTVSGDILVNITGGTIGTDDANSNDGVFGGGFGNGTSTSGNVSVTIKGSSVNVYGDVYGGSAKGSVNNDDNNKTIVTLASGTVHGDLYGGGLGDGKHAALVKGAVQVAIYGGTVDNVFGCNNAKGAPESMVQVIVNDTTAAQSMKVTNVFGGGNLAAYTGTPDVDILNGTINGNVFGGGNEAGVGGGDVTMSGGIVKKGLYGGCNTSGTITTNVTVNVEGGTVGTANTINGAVYGGGLGVDTKVKGDVTVTINGGTINNDVYGGSAKGMVNCNDEGTGATSGSKTYVTLKAGTINGSLYGGGHGIDKAKAHVWGPVQVTVNAGSVNGSVYGCNNASGAPQSTVKVDVYGTDTPASGYALANVFGGGNQAPFGGTPEVTIHNCENSIEFVYGGGNAASVAGTNVKVYGGNTIGNVFGGGNGTGVAAEFVMVTGNVLANIYGGTINRVFGGNNTSGVITGSATLNINKKAEVEGNDACKMYIGEVYGGGNLAAGKAGTITIGCTGDWTTTGTNNHTNHNSTTNRIGYELEGIGTVYGGANQAGISNDIILNINSGIVENVFGGNNTSGEISGTITVNIEKTGTCDWYVGNVFGGGNLAAYSNIPAVNIKNGMVSGSVFGGGNEAGVGGGNVTMTGGTVLVGLYGGCNTSGEVGGNITVDITGGTIGSADSLSSPRYITADVFGGGYGSATSTSGNVEVNINGSSVNIYGDVYGGSALGNVNNEATDKTTVNILEGILHSEEETIGGFIVYHGGNVYGGGLGRKDDPSTSGVDEAVEAKVYGEVTVNIGEISGTGATGGDQTGNSYSGNATIGGSVYGCNNTNGSPQQDVTVNIYATAHTDGNGGTPNNTFDGNAYAIANVFGGGNEAHYTPSVVKKKATVNIFGCDNTIGRTFGGGNAAHVGTTTVNASVETDILGGRIGQVFGGGNGERGPAYAANIYGNDTLKIHGGSIGQSFGGSNQNGTIFGAIDITVDENGCGSMEIDEFFCGGNFVDIIGGLTSTISCANGMQVKNLYGGCNMADIYGDVVLNVEGGEYINVFGGSKGDLVSLGGNHINKAANIKK